MFRSCILHLHYEVYEFPNRRLEDRRDNQVKRAFGVVRPKYLGTYCAVANICWSVPAHHFKAAIHHLKNNTRIHYQNNQIRVEQIIVLHVFFTSKSQSDRPVNFDGSNMRPGRGRIANYPRWTALDTNSAELTRLLSNLKTCGLFTRPLALCIYYNLVKSPRDLI